MSLQARLFRVDGRVQGVGFRYATQLRASELGLHGWVRNLPDGGVEVLAEGDDTALKALESWLRHGPRFARVDALTGDALPPERHDTFEIRR